MSGPISFEELQHQIAELYRPAPRGQWQRRVCSRVAQWLGRNDVRIAWTADEESADDSSEKFMLYSRTAPPRWIGFPRGLDRETSQVMVLLVPHIERVAQLMEDMIEPPAQPLPARWRQALTTRQAQVAVLAATGLKDTEIADHLGVAPRTVARLLQDTFKRLDVHSRHELAAELALGRPPTPHGSRDR